MSEREPFSSNGDSDGAVSGAQSDATSANAANPMTSADRPLTLPPASAVVCPHCGAGFHETEVGVCANLHPLCRCGAGPHAEREGFCSSSHPLPGHGGKLSLKHGLYAQQPIDTDVTVMASAAQRHQVLRQLFDAISREASRFADASRTHRLSARDQQHLLNLLDRLREIDDRLREMDAAPTDEGGGEAPADWPKRLALVFANQPDQFGEFITLLLTADRDRFGPLRSQVRLTLEHLEPQGKPVWRGHDADDDTVLL